MTGDLPFLTSFERNMLETSAEWFEENFPAALAPPSAQHVAPRPQDGKLLIICMTPRSGSTALSAALSASALLGRSGERLGSSSLMKTIEANKPSSLADLLRAVVEESRTPNGVAQIKCDLPQILPFLLDQASRPHLEKAHIVYLTREDILGQAISRYRGFQTGRWHSTQKHQGNTRDDAPYDFAAIKGQIDRLVQMMASYERIFASLNIRPMRITYEQVTRNSVTVMTRIAKAMGIALPPDISLESGGHAKIASENNDTLRERFLADCLSALRD